MTATADGLRVFSGSSHPELAREICDCLGIALGKTQTVRFSNENLKVRIGENVREQDVFVVQTSCPPLSEHIMELFILIDALKHSSARRITAVLPCFPYARSDKKDEPRISITARRNCCLRPSPPPALGGGLPQCSTSDAAPGLRAPPSGARSIG